MALTKVQMKQAALYAKILEMNEYELDELTTALADENPGSKDGPHTVTDFITKNCLNNGDGFYTPVEGEWPGNNEIANYLTEEELHPELHHWAALPYGRICPHCGGSMMAIIQFDKNDKVLRTDCVDCG